MPKYNDQPFSCINPGGRFHTDTSGQQGYPHLPLSTTLGSALRMPLFVDQTDGGSLWLEHVVDENGGWPNTLWMMWYDGAGNPRLDRSAVFDTEALSALLAQFPEFLRTDR
jgi:hypothetical protein